MNEGVDLRVARGVSSGVILPDQERVHPCCAIGLVHQHFLGRGECCPEDVVTLRAQEGSKNLHMLAIATTIQINYDSLTLWVVS